MLKYFPEYLNYEIPPNGQGHIYGLHLCETLHPPSCQAASPGSVVISKAEVARI